MKYSLITQILLAIVFFIITVGGYFLFPSIIITHWGAQGEPNGTMTREANALFMSGIFLILYMILKFSIRADPNKLNTAKFKDSFEWFIAFMELFFVCLNIFVTIWNLGYKVEIYYFMLPMFSMLFLALGWLLFKTEKNNTIGIRTPWTLADDEVWHKTHQLGGKLFIISGLVTIFGVFLKDYAIYFMLIPVFLASGIAVVYSYIVYSEKYRKIKDPQSK